MHAGIPVLASRPLPPRDGPILRATARQLLASLDSAVKLDSPVCMPPEETVVASRSQGPALYVLVLDQILLPQGRQRAIPIASPWGTHGSGCRFTSGRCGLKFICICRLTNRA